MHIYETKNPYYAMIVAEDKDSCLNFYNDVVSDTEGYDDFASEIQEVSLAMALNTLAKAPIEDDYLSGVGIGIDEAHKQLAESLNQKEPSLLLIDGDLI